MKVLVVSHTAVGKTGNMGKTMLSYFRDFQPDELAQFYIHNEVPTDASVCHNYYRFTDVDALKSIFLPKRTGVIFSRKDIREDLHSGRMDERIVRAAYQLGRKRSAGVYFARNLLWRLGNWKTREFRDWLLAFAPDVIFFMSGDYRFMYDIACYAAKLTKSPLVMCCVDDYFLHNRNHGSLLGRWEHRKFLKTVERTLEKTSCIFTICDAMSDSYAQHFQKPCYTLHTAAEMPETSAAAKGSQISYIGNLDLGRHVQLVAMGRALRSLGRTLDVYSPETRLEVLRILTEENGIRFHGRIPAHEVLCVMRDSQAVVHTESFDPKFRRIVQYSVSTKIAESLMYGPCLIAYGPDGIASMDYLKAHDAAYVITSESALKTGLADILENKARRAEILSHARSLAKENHSLERNGKFLRKCLEAVVGELQ